ncbi:MAG: 4-(cytidine 5'-diphospho)-2-C-methyl-D-erythritol kinase [Lentisphaeria bacterium]|nr:4-(cytidine 5'-diphospho)-2-C-methyl-D-erythritol kinase [Lentisphaeria bacterium]
MLTCSKVNLSLAVTAKRPDGYHDLDSLFYPFRDPSDEIRLDDAPAASGVAIRCDAPGVPLEPEKNLCGKAVYAYCKAAGMDVPGLVIHLEKHIPVAAGMGGGSADGAAVLRLLQERFRALSQERLESIAFSLGADVPFFLNPRPSHVTGAGEHLVPVDGLPERLPILLAAPQFPVSAAWAYQHMDLARAVAEPPRTNELIDALRRRDFESAAQFMRNDLEHALFVKFPLLVLLRDFLLKHGALRAMVSGSGPTILALFRDDAAAHAAHARAASEFDPCVRFLLPE